MRVGIASVLFYAASFSCADFLAISGSAIGAKRTAGVMRKRNYLTGSEAYRSGWRESRTGTSMREDFISLFNDKGVLASYRSIDTHNTLT